MPALVSYDEPQEVSTQQSCTMVDDYRVLPSQNVQFAIGSCIFSLVFAAVMIIFLFKNMPPQEDKKHGLYGWLLMLAAIAFCIAFAGAIALDPSVSQGVPC